MGVQSRRRYMARDGIVGRITPYRLPHRRSACVQGPAPANSFPSFRHPTNPVPLMSYRCTTWVRAVGPCPSRRSSHEPRRPNRGDVQDARWSRPNGLLLALGAAAAVARRRREQRAGINRISSNPRRRTCRACPCRSRICVPGADRRWRASSCRASARMRLHHPRRDSTAVTVRCSAGRPQRERSPSGGRTRRTGASAAPVRRDRTTHEHTCTVFDSSLVFYLGTAPCIPLTIGEEACTRSVDSGTLRP